MKDKETVQDRIYSLTECVWATEVGVAGLSQTAALCFMPAETWSAGASYHQLGSFCVYQSLPPQPPRNKPFKAFPFKNAKWIRHSLQAVWKAAEEIFITKRWSLNGAPFVLKQMVVKRACIDLVINLYTVLYSLIHYGLVVTTRTRGHWHKLSWSLCLRKLNKSFTNTSHGLQLFSSQASLFDLGCVIQEMFCHLLQTCRKIWLSRFFCFSILIFWWKHSCNKNSCHLKTCQKYWSKNR